MFHEKLVEKQWNEIECASGKGDHIPWAMSQFNQSNAYKRERAYFQIDNEAICQGDLYEGAAYVIAPVIKMLIDPQIQFGKDLMYDLLIEIALGYAPQDQKVNLKDGSILSVKEACEIQLNENRWVFERDLNDKDFSKYAAELIEILDEDEEE